MEQSNSKERTAHARDPKLPYFDDSKDKMDSNLHYENTPIQICRKFHLQKLKIFRQKTLFFIFLLKT